MCISIGSYVDALKYGLHQRGIDSKMLNRTSSKQYTSVLLKHSKGRDETKGKFHLEKGISECNTSYKPSYSVSSGSNPHKSYLDAAKGAEDLSFGIPKTIIKTSNSTHNKVKVKCLNSVANSEYTIPGKGKANDDGT